MAASRYVALNDSDGNDETSRPESIEIQRMPIPADTQHDQHPISPIATEYRRASVSSITTTTTMQPHHRVESFPEVRVENLTEPEMSSLKLHSINSLDVAHDDALARQSMLKAQEAAARRLSIEDRIKYSFSPATHHEKYPGSENSSLLSRARTDGGSETARVYSFWRQTKRLWRLAAAEWFFTAALCGAFAGALKYYERQTVVTSQQMLILNAFTTGLTFLLGVNLTASMRSYAKLLRWLLLSLCWQPLETFDLMLRCESLLNCCKLAWKARKHKSRRLRFITVAMSLLWLLSTLALTLFVGMLGLTYSIDPTNEYRDTVPGTVQITDLSQIDSGEFAADVGRIQTWGVQGISTQCGAWNATESYSCYTTGKGIARRWLAAWNPDDLSIGLSSLYLVDSIAHCTEYRVVSGMMGNNTRIIIEKNGKNLSVPITTWSKNVPGPGGLVAWASECRNCQTDRYTWMAFYKAGTTTTRKAQYFECPNTVDTVYHWDSGSQTFSDAPSEYQFDNDTARMLAGALGWTGDVFIGSNTTWQGAVYKNFSAVADQFTKTYGDAPITADQAADFIAAFTIKAITFVDVRGSSLGRFKEAEGMVPLRAQVLNVTWRNATLLLAGIPGLQLAACILVFAVANRAIIKDDSSLSMAKLYYNLLSKYGLGDRGCMLKGEEIVEYIGERTTGPQGPMVTYGFKLNVDREGNEIGHLDVYERSDQRTEVYQTGADVTVKPRERMYVRSDFKEGIEYDGGIEAKAKSDEHENDGLRRRVLT